MGWTAYYQILRDRPLDDSELARVEDFIDRANQPRWDCESFGLAVTRDARADRVLGYGWTKLAMDLDESDDAARLCDALNALPDVVSGVEVRVSDDFESFGFDDGKVVLGGRPGEQLVELRDRDVFQSPRTLIGPREKPLDPRLAAMLGDPPARDALRGALVAFAQLGDHPCRAAIGKAFGNVPPLDLALAGLDVYRDLHRTDAWTVVAKAIEVLPDVAPIAEAFLEVWCNPHGIYWYGDMAMPRLAELARLPAVEDQLLLDLANAVDDADSEVAHRRAELAAKLLGATGTPTALAALIEAARVLRAGMSSNQRYHTNLGVHEGLVASDARAAVPTLLVAFTEIRGTFHYHRGALGMLAKHAPAQILPVLRRFAALGESLDRVIPALRLARDVETLRELCGFPSESIRSDARAALRELGSEPPDEGPVPEPETLVTHPCASVREHARREIERTGDPAFLTSVVACLVLESAISRRTTGGSTASGGSYLELLPEALRHERHQEQLAALRAGVPGLPPQTIWPAVQPILDADVDALAATYAALEWRLTNAMPGLLAVEQGVLAALRDGRLDVDIAAAPVLDLAAPIDPAGTPAGGAAVDLAAPSASAGAPREPDGIIDELLDCIAREEKPSADLMARAQLPGTAASSDSWDRGKVLAAKLLQLPAIAVAQRILARLAELHDASSMRDVYAAVMPQLAKTDAPALAQVFDEAHELPWTSPSRLEVVLGSVAAVPEVFQRVVDELVAPGRAAGSAFDLLQECDRRRDEATAVVIARLRADRGKPHDMIRWRTDAYRALRKGYPEAVPTAMLELADIGSLDRGSALVEGLAHDPRGRTFLTQLLDLPELATSVARELCRSRSDDVRIQFLEHPYWKLRLIAADANNDWDRSKREAYAVWAAIDAAGLAVPEDDRRYARPSDASADVTWQDLARAHGRPLELPAFPPARDGLGAACADYRRWAFEAVDMKLDSADLVARIFADELDAALVAYGHRRNTTAWRAWRAKVPELPAERTRRSAWAREQGVALPPVLERVREVGAMTVAAELPRPYLVLSPELRAELEALERPLAERGEALLRG